VDDALSSLATLDPRKAAVVELRFFGGLTLEETAEHLGISAETVSREWRRARAWLYEELSRREARPLAR
jgi:RNA polymerase sigma factor (sigma-70 family)